MDLPRHLDVRKDHGVTVTWNDGRTSFYSVVYLRRNSPSADMKHLREQLRQNPLTVLPSSARSPGPLTITSAELVGKYALKVEFSDGHSTGIYSWEYLRSIDPGPNESQPSSGG